MIGVPLELVMVPAGGGAEMSGAHEAGLAIAGSAPAGYGFVAGFGLLPTSAFADTSLYAGFTGGLGCCTSRSWQDSACFTLPTTLMCSAVDVCGQPPDQMSESASEFTSTSPLTVSDLLFCTWTMPISSLGPLLTLTHPELGARPWNGARVRIAKPGALVEPRL